jgi:cytochrome c oxidase subunit II
MNNYGWSLPLAASTYAAKIDFGIWLIHAAMAAIFVLWGIFFTYLLVKYRARPGVAAVREDETKHGAAGELKSLAPDLLVMLFEIALIVFYAIPVWSRIKMTQPETDAKLKIELIAEQFAWNVHYPGPDGKLGPRRNELIHFSNPIGLDHADPASADDVVMGNELRLPVNKPVHIQLFSKDVIHSFFVPEFRIKQDMMPGMSIPLWVEPTVTGKFEITCAQLCGFGHSLMRGDVYVSTDEEFDAWYKSRLALAPAAPKASNPAEDF